MHFLAQSINYGVTLESRKNMKNKKYFKINEFAKLCHTTKDTLLHYDKKNLLKPEYTAENKYRYYSIEQFFKYNLITLLKGTERTLEEIKKSLNSNEPEQRINLIEERIEQLKNEQKEIEKRISMFSTLAALSKKALTQEYDTLFFEDINEETVYLFPIRTAEDVNQIETYTLCLSDFLLDYINHEHTPVPPLGMLITKRDIAKQRFTVNSFFAKASEQKKAQTKIIKKGRYACWLHKGKIDSQEQACHTFIDLLRKRGYSLKSDLFLFDQMNCLIDETNEELIINYAIKISKKKQQGN